jgi:hypothetical protein
MSFIDNQLSKSSVIGYQSLSLSLNLQAAKLIQEFILNPSLAGVILYLEEYSKKIHSEVAKKKLINASGSKSVVTDNIAPEPFVWTLKGYIKSDTTYEFTNRLVPSLKRKQQLLENACYSRISVDWRDKDCYRYKVGIEDIEFLGEPDNQNHLHFSAVLVEINVLTTTQTITKLSEQKANDVSGTNNGNSSNLGGTSGSNKTTLKTLFDEGGITKVLTNIGR